MAAAAGVRAQSTSCGCVGSSISSDEQTSAACPAGSMAFRIVRSSADSAPQTSVAARPIADPAVERVFAKNRGHIACSSSQITPRSPSGVSNIS